MVRAIRVRSSRAEEEMTGNSLEWPSVEGSTGSTGHDRERPSWRREQDLGAVNAS